VFNVFDRQSIRRLDIRYNLPEHGHCGGIAEAICNGDGGILHGDKTVAPVGSLTNPRGTAPNESFLKKGVEFSAPRTIRLGVRYRF
jgi:hypothetical protein